MLIMARAGVKTLDYLVLGDSALLLEDASGEVDMITDRRMGRVAVAEYQAVLELPIGSKEHQAARIAFVRRQQPMRNKPGGYPVASTDPSAAAETITGSVPVSGVRRAAMVSDGVTRFAEFGLGTWADLLEVLSRGGPGMLVGRIRGAEDGDPAGRRWPRAKKHDDAGVVFWENEDVALPGRRPVVAAIVTSPAGVLVGRRNDGKPPWTFIAGEQEPGERPEDTAVREVKEEAALQIQAGDVIGERVHPKTGRQMIYVAGVPTHGTDVFVGDEQELAEVRWVNLAETDELMGGAIYEPVRQHLARVLNQS
jgi:8-oxo-dGTP pyrophosphatase MutT (NUDIX family)